MKEHVQLKRVQVSEAIFSLKAISSCHVGLLKCSAALCNLKKNTIITLKTKQLHMNLCLMWRLDQHVAAARLVRIASRWFLGYIIYSFSFSKQEVELWIFKWLLICLYPEIRTRRLSDREKMVRSLSGKRSCVFNVSTIDTVFISVSQKLELILCKWC